MKKLRFIIAIVLIFSLLPVFSVSANEQADEIKATETYEFKKLEAFGLISESDAIFYYDNVRRGEFLSYVMKSYPGYSASAPIPGVENPFTDVAEKHEHFNAITAAAYMGIINGTSGSEFRPSDNITKSEAAKIFATMLGYTEYAERKGGYPVGYLNIAEKLGLFSGCEFTPEGYFTVKDFLKAYGNVLDTEVLEVRAVSVSPSGEVISQDYKSLEERTLLYYTFGIYEAKGIVEINEYTSINGLSDLETGEVVINGYVYKANDSNATALLGYNTHYYYKKDRDAVHGEIVYIEPYRNNVVDTYTNLIAKDYVSETNFRYYRDAGSEKYQDLKIARSAALIHNGDLDDVTKANLCPNNGTVTLIDNNDDKVYDVIFVMDYRTIMVSSVSPVTYQIMDAFDGDPIELDPEAEDYDVKLEILQPINKGNEEYRITMGLYGEYLPPVKSEFSEIKKGDIILYAESENNNKDIKQVKVSRNIVEGRVTSVFKDYILIGDQKYELSPDAKYKVSPGEEGKFHLDAFDRIVTKSLDQKKVYGYLNAIDKDDSAFGNVARVQIFTESNRWAVLELADNVKTNIKGASAGFETLKPEEVYDELMAMPDFRQLITYTVNKEGKVNNITIAQKLKAYSDAETDAMEQDVFRKVWHEDWSNNTDDCLVTGSRNDSGQLMTSVRTYNYFGTSIGYLDILLDSNITKVFVICEDNPELTQMEPVARLSTGGKFIPYDLNERRIAGAVVIFRNASTFSATNAASLVFVQEIIETTNMNGDLVKGITGICEGLSVTLVASSNTLNATIDQLSKGDVIQVALDKNGEIVDNPPADIDATTGGSIKRRLNLNDKDLKPLDTTVRYSYYGEVCTVYYVDAKANRILVEGKDDKKRFINVATSTKYYIYDSEEDTVTNGSLADLAKGTFLLVRRSDDRANYIVIYK